MNIEAGRLRHRISIEIPIDTQDPVTGEMTRGWATWKTVWAAIEPLSAREFIASQAVQSEVRGKIIIRRLEGLQPSARVNHNGTIYQIFGVIKDPDSGLEWMTLPVGEGVDPGAVIPLLDSNGDPIDDLVIDGGAP